MEEKAKNTILVVDDDSVYMNFLVQLLKDEYTIFVAKSGNAAITMAMNEVPDLILLDVTMPDITGHEVILSLKFMNETKKIPTIFITSLDSPEDKIKGFQLGAVDYIQKNSSPDAIKDTIQKQIEIINAKRG